MKLAAAFASCLAVLVLAATPALAAGDRYSGETSDGRTVKFVTDRDGAVVRGAVTTMTRCTDGYDPFRARFELDRPLDRSNRDRFKDSGSDLQQDDRFSARYAYDIEGKRKGPNVLTGSFDLTVVFRKNGEKYTTCSADGVEFEARRAGSD